MRLKLPARKWQTGVMAHPKPHGQFPSLLIIDDDLISREVMSMMLEMHGFPVSSAESGEEALDLIGSPHPEVILMDTQMPGLSGTELIQAIRQSSAAIIVAISGSPVRDSILNLTDGFLLKPVEPDALEALLNALGSDTGDLAGTPAETPRPREPVEDLLDPIILAKLRGMMSARALREIYSAVAADLRPRLRTLQNALEAGDAAEVSRIAHAIKGGCAMVGFTSAEKVAAQFEMSNISEAWVPQLAKLQSALDALECMLISEFKV